MARKKVLLLIIDALTPSAFVQAMKDGRLPTFKSIWERGVLQENYCSVFPSITHACLSSIATGQYPIEHGILGTVWHDKENGESAYYGAQFWLVLNQGVNKFYEDLLWKMNERRLRAPTIFERVEEAGLKAACLNHLFYRGRKEYEVHQPLLIKLIPFLGTNKSLHGPSILFLGDFVPLEINGEKIDTPGGPDMKFGMADPCAIAAMHAMAERNSFPDFTLAYFPDNDVKSHKEGPKGAVEALEKLDEGLRVFLLKMGGLEQFLQEFAILIHGDHAQIEMSDGEEYGGILLDDILGGEFELIRPGAELERESQLLAAPNLRTLFVYFYKPDVENRDHATRLLLEDKRVDQVMWQAEIFDPGSKGFVVQTKSRGTLRFWSGEDGENCAKDDYGKAWCWEGNPEALDFTVEDGRLKWADYPNAFERIACGVGPKHAGHLWATAKPGFGFRLKEVGAHAGGGSHASLHKGDSFTAMLAAGLPEDVDLPEHGRIVDTAPLVMKILGLRQDNLSQPRFRQGMEAYLL